jgi:hypothetical protein
MFRFFNLLTVPDKKSRSTFVKPAANNSSALPRIVTFVLMKSGAVNNPFHALTLFYPYASIFMLRSFSKHRKVNHFYFSIEPLFQLKKISL